MNLYNNKLYLEDVQYVAGLKLPWEKLSDKSIMLSGATGMIGSFLVDVVLEKNIIDDLNCIVYALGRNKKKPGRGLISSRMTHILSSFLMM